MNLKHSLAFTIVLLTGMVGVRSINYFPWYLGLPIFLILVVISAFFFLNLVKEKK